MFCYYLFFVLVSDSLLCPSGLVWDNHWRDLANSHWKWDDNYNGEES